MANNKAASPVWSKDSIQYVGSEAIIALALPSRRE